MDVGGAEVQLTSTTTMLKELGLVDTRWFKPEHAKAGSDRHLIVEHYSRGNLFEVDALLIAKPELESALLAWKAFVAESGFEAEHVEVGVYSLGDELRAGFAGRIDVVGKTWGGKAIVDVKSKSKLPSYSLQLHGYADAWAERTGVQVDQLLAVHLNAPSDGRYSVESYSEDEVARAAWQSVRIIKKWKDGGLFSDEIATAMVSLLEWWRNVK